MTPEIRKEAVERRWDSAGSRVNPRRADLGYWNDGDRPLNPSIRVSGHPGLGRTSLGGVGGDAEVPATASLCISGE
jgi:hypothetical protein